MAGIKRQVADNCPNYNYLTKGASEMMQMTNVARLQQHRVEEPSQLYLRCNNMISSQYNYNSCIKDSALTTLIPTASVFPNLFIETAAPDGGNHNMFAGAAERYCATFRSMQEVGVGLPAASSQPISMPRSFWPSTDNSTGSWSTVTTKAEQTSTEISNILKRMLKSSTTYDLMRNVQQFEEEEEDVVQSEGDSGGGCGTILNLPARKKKRLTEEQVRALEESFKVNRKLDAERKKQLAKCLGLHPRQVAVWFQNRRARSKTKHLEQNLAILKSQYHAALAETIKLQSEVTRLTAEMELATSTRGSTSTAVDHQGDVSVVIRANSARISACETAAVDDQQQQKLLNYMEVDNDHNDVLTRSGLCNLDIDQIKKKKKGSNMNYCISAAPAKNLVDQVLISSGTDDQLSPSAGDNYNEDIASVGLNTHVAASAPCMSSSISYCASPTSSNYNHNNMISHHEHLPSHHTTHNHNNNIHEHLPSPHNTLYHDHTNSSHQCMSRFPHLVLNDPHTTSNPIPTPSSYLTLPLHGLIPTPTSILNDPINPLPQLLASHHLYFPHDIDLLLPH